MNSYLLEAHVFMVYYIIAFLLDHGMHLYLHLLSMCPYGRNML